MIRVALGRILIPIVSLLVAGGSCVANAQDASLEIAEQVTRLRRLLSHDDAAIRAKAANDLAALGPAAKDAAPDIVERMIAEPANSDLYSALFHIGPSSIEPSFQAFARADETVRCEFVTLWGALNKKGVDVGKQMQAALKDPSQSVRNLAIEGIAYSDKMRVYLPHFLAVLKDEKSPDRTQVATVIHAYGEAASPALPTLLKLLNSTDRDSSFRATLVFVVGHIGVQDKSIANLLHGILTDKQESVKNRTSASEGLGVSKFGQIAMADLIQVLKAPKDNSEEGWQLRYSAVKSMGLLRPTRDAIEPLMKMLDDELVPIYLTVKALSKAGPVAKDYFPQIMIKLASSRENLRVTPKDLAQDLCTILQVMPTQLAARINQLADSTTEQHFREGLDRFVELLNDEPVRIGPCE